MHSAKIFVANTIAALLTFSLCWFVLAFFDEQTGRACIYAICLTLIMVAWGLRSWERDETFLSIKHLFLWLIVVLAVIALMLAIDLLSSNRPIQSIGEIENYLRSSNSTWLYFTALILGWVVLPFLFASVVRASVIWLMCRVFKATAFGLATSEQVADYKEREERGSWFANSGQLAGLLVMGILWPGGWAIHAYRHDNEATGIAAFIAWCIAYFFLALFLHQKRMVRMQVSLLGAAITMLAVAFIVW